MEKKIENISTKISNVRWDLEFFSELSTRLFQVCDSIKIETNKYIFYDLDDFLKHNKPGQEVNELEIKTCNPIIKIQINDDQFLIEARLGNEKDRDIFFEIKEMITKNKGNFLKLDEFILSFLTACLISLFALSLIKAFPEIGEILQKKYAASLFFLISLIALISLASFILTLANKFEKDKKNRVSKLKKRDTRSFSEKYRDYILVLISAIFGVFLAAIEKILEPFSGLLIYFSTYF